MIDSNNLLGETVFRLVVGSSATGGSEDGEKSAKHYKNKILAISCDNRPCSQNITKIVILTARSFPYQNHVTVKLVILVDPHYTKDHILTRNMKMSTYLSQVSHMVDVLLQVQNCSSAQNSQEMTT